MDTVSGEEVCEHAFKGLGPVNVKATDALLRSIQTENRLSHVVFRERQLGYLLVVRKKYLLTQMEED